MSDRNHGSGTDYQQPFDPQTFDRQPINQHGHLIDEQLIDKDNLSFSF